MEHTHIPSGTTLAGDFQPLPGFSIGTTPEIKVVFYLLSNHHFLKILINGKQSRYHFPAIRRFCVVVVVVVFVKDIIEIYEGPHNRLGRRPPL